MRCSTHSFVAVNEVIVVLYRRLPRITDPVASAALSRGPNHPNYYGILQTAFLGVLTTINVKEIVMI